MAVAGEAHAELISDLAEFEEPTDGAADEFVAHAVAEVVFDQCTADVELGLCEHVFERVQLALAQHLEGVFGELQGVERGFDGCWHDSPGWYISQFDLSIT